MNYKVRKGVDHWNNDDGEFGTLSFRVGYASNRYVFADKYFCDSETTEKDKYFINMEVYRSKLLRKMYE